MSYGSESEAVAPRGIASTRSGSALRMDAQYGGVKRCGRIFAAFVNA